MWKFNRFANFVLRQRYFSSKQNQHVSKKFDISEEVRHALENVKPVVALESTIITHGMPYPDNLKCALDVENIIREQGAIPATIAILGGKVTVGLNEKQISEIADTKLTPSVKTSRRDLSYIVSQKLNGGTTVSGTIVIAEKVGIPIFVTGGIGGVHRQGEHTLDISADLTELGRSSVAVISSGVKSILDIPKTLEYLETQGVFVATYGPNTNFPAFYTRNSGCQAPYNVPTALVAAKAVFASLSLNMKSGLLFAVPIPEEEALDQETMEHVISEALAKAEKEGISGKRVTPFLLGKVKELTKGQSLKANVALIRNNAKVGADIAVELSKLRNEKEGVSSMNTKSKPKFNNTPLVIGGCVLDSCAKLSQTDITLDGSMHYTKFTISSGGVGRNICDALSKLGCEPALISTVGNDNHGTYIRSLLPTKASRYIKSIPNASTAQCTVVLDSNGDCKLLLGEMDVFNEITPEMIKSQEQLLKQSPLVVLDGNLTIESISCILELAEKYNVPVFYEPTDVPVAFKPLQAPSHKALKFISPNLNELKMIAKYLAISVPSNDSDILTQAANLGKLVAEHVDTVIITLGPLGLMIFRKADSSDCLLNPVNKSNDIQTRYYKTDEVKQLVNVSGAGDCLASGIMSAMLRGKSEATCISVGFAAAKMALQSQSAVPKELLDDNHESWNKEATFVEL